LVNLGYSEDNQGVFMLENVLILVTVNVRLALMATTVDFGQVCIVFLLLYLVNLGYSEDKQRVFMLEIIFILVTVNLRLALMATTRLWTSVGYVLSFSSVIVP
jgi:hypothetical protein